jgi:hypothetical protein
VVQPTKGSCLREAFCEPYYSKIDIFLILNIKLLILKERKMEKFSSKFIEEKDILILKPTYLRTLNNIKNQTEIKIKIKNFSVGFDEELLSDIKEFFVNEKTLFSVKVPISEVLKNELFDYFYNLPDEEGNKKTYDNITIYSKFFYFDKLQKECYLKFDNNHFEVIPSKDEVVFNFLIDNLDLAQKLQKATTTNSKI